MGKEISLEEFFGKMDGGAIPQVSNFIPIRKEELTTDITELLVGRGRLQTKFTVNAFGWSQEAMQFFEKTAYDFAKQAEISVTADLHTDRNNNPTVYTLFVSNKGKEYSEFLRGLVERMGSTQKISHKRSIQFKVTFENIIEENGEEVTTEPLKLGDYYGIIQMKNLAAEEPFSPIISYNWDEELGIPADVRIRTDRDEKSCIMTRLRNNAGCTINMQYYSSFLFIGFAYNKETKQYEFVVNRGETDERGKVTTSLLYHKSKEGEKLADAVMGIIGPAKDIIDNGTALRQYLTNLEDATEELLSKNEIEDSDLIFIIKDKPKFEGEETYQIGDSVEKDESDDEDEEEKTSSEKSAEDDSEFDE